MRSDSLKKWLGVVLLLGALLGSLQIASARETLLISGNADLYPIESYDRTEERYVGLLPELYVYLSECTEYDFIYLPYSQNTTQAQQAKNRQADIISAYPAGAVSDALLRRRVLICQGLAGTDAVYVGFTEALSQARADELAQALESISGAEKLGVLADYAGKNGVGVWRTRWLITLAVLVVVVLAAAVALVVSLRKKHAELRAGALLDPRYGIGNDRFYLHCMETLLPAPLRSLTYVVCFGCDMPVLESRCGEPEREDLFCRAAEFLSRNCAREDYLACVGNGMFAIVCQRGSRDAMHRRAISLVQRLDAYLTGFRSEYGGAFRAGICSLEENPDCTAEAALFSARQGCAYAFAHDLLCAFSTRGMVSDSEQLERLRRRMTEAIEKDEFKPYFQFIVDRSGTVVGAEVVSRWHNPSEGVLSPSKYIDLMIRAGTITELDLYLFRSVCAQLQQWKLEGKEDLFLSCNFSRQSIADKHTLARVCKIAGQYDFSHDRLLVEITEDSLTRNRDTALETVSGLRSLGFRIALDDIGAGCSSLSDLCAFPINCVKIDRSILLNAGEKRGRALLTGVAQLAHRMGIHVLCEGVETEEQLNIVLAAGSDLIQGYYFSRVLPRREAERYLRERTGQ